MTAMVDFSKRNALTELMDSDATDFDTFRACLVDLGKVNRLTLAHRPTLSFLRKLAVAQRPHWDRTISIVDVGSGSGDMLRAIDRWAAGRGYVLDLVGIDLNPWSAITARELTQTRRPIRFVTANIFDYEPQAPVDIVISSLFTHHLDDAGVVRFIRWMDAHARLGWFVNDLHRQPLPYHLFRHTARALHFHHFVQHDGPVSIARAFQFADWHELLDAAEVSNAVVEKYFPFRLCVARTK